MTVIGKRIVALVPQEHSRLPITGYRIVSLFPNIGQWSDDEVELHYSNRVSKSAYAWFDQLIVVSSSDIAFSTRIKAGNVSYNWLIFRRISTEFSMLRPGCHAGKYSANWSAVPCRRCQVGYYSSPGSKVCKECPNGLSTLLQGATSLADCKCDPNYCKNGRCFIANSEFGPRPECKCEFGYAGERCEFPTLLIATCTLLAAAILIAGLFLAIQKAVRYRKVNQTREAELTEMSEVWTVKSSEVVLLETIDSSSPGSYGDVYRARYRDMIVAVKKLKGIMRNWQVEREFEREIQLMKSIRHMNVVLFLGAGKYDDDGCPFLVLEYMIYGALTGVLRNTNVTLRREQRMSFCLDAAKGLQFLHSLNPPRIHRDIKSNNLLLSANWVVKVADFGCARLVKTEGGRQQMWKRSPKMVFDSFQMEARKPLLKADDHMSDNVGAVLWRAPEIFARQSYGTPVDVYSFGIVVWEIAVRKMPYDERGFEWIEDVKDAVMRGERPRIPQTTHRDFVHLMKRCWADNSCDRPVFSEIVQILQSMIELEREHYAEQEV